MPRIPTRLMVLLAKLMVATALWAGGASLVSAQQRESAPPPKLPVQHPSETKLNEQQLRGAGLFIQRCALCHLAKTFGQGGNKYCCVASLGPNLGGLYKDLTPTQEKAMRQFILNGGPAWKYALEPKEIDDIVAYLKTLE
jgi:mono/diheme cytochrome c family protein